MARILHFMRHLYNEIVEAATLQEKQRYMDAMENFTRLLAELTEEVQGIAEVEDDDEDSDTST